MNKDARREPGKESERRGRQAPAIPDGWATGPPDFIGVGVHKAGTTWWWALLVQHPEIDAVARRKELHLLERMRAGPITDEQKAWYYRQFVSAPGNIAGEWTPRYQAMPPMPGIIEEVAPEAKLITILRDPVERYRSGLNQWQEQTKRRSLKRDEKAGKREALMRGFYGRQVQRLQDAVGPDRLLVLQYERCVRDPAGQFARTLVYLEVSPFTPKETMLKRRFNETVGTKGDLSSKEDAALVAEYEPEVRLLKQLVPDIDLSLWPRFSHVDG